MARWTVAWGLPTLALLAAPARPAEPTTGERAQPHAWRVILGPSLSLPSFGTTYVSRYSPPFEGTPHASAATQTMPLDAGSGPGVLVGIERNLGSHLGLQLSADYGAADLSGAPGQYDLTMRYTSRPPPFYEPIEVSLDRSEAQPAAVGRLKTLALSLDLVAWASLGAHGRIGVSAGPAWLHTEGSAQSLVYTKYSMGGHSTAFDQDYLVSLGFPGSTLGLVAGAFVEAGLGGHAGLRLDLRYGWGPATDAVVTLREIVNAGEVIRSADLAEIQSGLSPAPVRVDPSFFRAAVALALRF
ncbi:MAG TPA: hypothetical protein VMT70_20570 [Vicinamibacteria bacterium]|nr:hypothetical protein [Vicinamibacteria bacterium]